MTTKVYIEEKVERENIDGCPNCGGTNVERDDYGYDGQNAHEYWEAYTCRDCEQEYVDVYSYKHTEYVKEVTR